MISVAGSAHSPLRSSTSLHSQSMLPQSRFLIQLIFTLQPAISVKACLVTSLGITWHLNTGDRTWCSADPLGSQKGLVSPGPPIRGVRAVSTLRAVPTHLSFGQRARSTQLLPTEMHRRLSEKARGIPGCGMKLEPLCLTLDVPKEHPQTFSGELTPETSLSQVFRS